MQGRPWERYSGSAPAASPQVIEGPPRLPNLPPGQTPAQSAYDRERLETEELRQRRLQQQIGDADREREQASLARRNAAALHVRNGRIVIGTIDRALANIGASTTGVPGAIIGRIPGTSAYNLRGQLETIRANLGFDRLQQMRDASPTGGALGQVAIQELTALQASLGNLDTAQSEDEIRTNLQQIRQHYANWIAAVEGTATQGQQQRQPSPASQRGAAGLPPAPGTPPDDPNVLQVDVTGGRWPSSVEEAVQAGWSAEQISEAVTGYANARQGNPNLTFQEFLASGQHRISPTQPNDGHDMLSRSIAALTAAGINPVMAIAALAGDQNAGATIRGAQDTLTLGTRDEITGAIRTLGGGTVAENIQREREIDRNDPGVARFAGQLAGGIGLPTFGLSGVRGGTALGAGYGAGYGFGSGEGGLIDRGTNALYGGAVGVAAGAGAGAFGNYLVGRAARRADARDLIDAADRQGIPIMPADVGGSFTRRLTAGTAQTLGGGGQVIRAAQRTSAAAGEARDRIASGVGQAMDPEDAGVAARQGAQAYISRTGDRGNQLYRRAERAAGDARITPVRAWEVLDQHIAELGETPGGAEGLTALQTLRQELNGTFTVAGMRRMRTALRDRFISSGLRGSDIERRIGQVIDAASEDVASGLTAQGRGVAARAYAQADRYWRDRLQTIDNVMEPFIGNGQSGETIVRSLQTAARGNTERLSRFIQSLPAEEAAVVRATLISQLGRPSASIETGATFSLNQFLTHWSQMTPRARETLFPREALSALNDLARVARGSRQAQGYLNRSNTAGATVPALTGAMGGFPALLGLISTSYAAGRLLASPAFARWLAGAGRTRNPRLHLQGLTTIAARNPAIAQDVLGLQRMLMNAVNDNLPQAGRVAASPDEGPNDADQ